MKTPRVVLDTHVLMAGLRSRDGASYRVLRRVGTGAFVTVVSVPWLPATSSRCWR